MQPAEDRLNYVQDYLEERLGIMLGGRCAEKLMLGSVSSGAADDLKQCTRLARRMITQWGMNERLGPLSLPQSEEHPFLGMDMTKAREFSEHTARIIDEEVEKQIKQSEIETYQLLSDHQEQLECLAKDLLKHETLEADEVKSLLKLN
jgi:cell division protease FtsH